MPEFVNPFVGMIPGRKMTHSELIRALRLSLSAEEEAVHIYDAIAEACDNELASAVLVDIAREERVHKGEFQKLIEMLSFEEVNTMKEGALEVEEIREKLENKSRQEQLATVGNLKKANI